MNPKLGYKLSTAKSGEKLQSLETVQEYELMQEAVVHVFLEGS